MGGIPLARIAGVPNSSSDASTPNSGKALVLQESHNANHAPTYRPVKKIAVSSEAAGSSRDFQDPMMTGKLQLLVDGGAYFGGLAADGNRAGAGVELLPDGSRTILDNGNHDKPSEATNNDIAVVGVNCTPETSSRQSIIDACFSFCRVLPSSKSPGWICLRPFRTVGNTEFQASSPGTDNPVQTWRRSLMDSPIYRELRSSSCALDKISLWSTEVVLAWLRKNGLEKHVHAFQDNGVTGNRLLTLDHIALEKELCMFRYGERCEMLAAISRLKEETLSEEHAPATENCSGLAFPFEALQIGSAAARSLHVRGVSFEETTQSLFCGSFYGKDAMVRILHGRSVDQDRLSVALKDLNSLRHPGLILLLGTVAWKKEIRLVSEMVSGCSLDAHFERAARVAGYLVAPTLKALIQIAREVAVAMHYLHEHEVWHLRLRPTNVLLDASMSVKIADYAVNLLQCCLEVSPQHLQHRLWDCCPWTSPEMLRVSLWRDTPRPVSNMDLDDPAAADVYSFGVILWELLACRRPFDDISAAQLMLAVGLGKHHLPRLQYAGAAGELAHACTQYQPGKRPVFSEVIRVLRPSSAMAKAEAAHEAVAAFLG